VRRGERPLPKIDLGIPARSLLTRPPEVAPRSTAASVRRLVRSTGARVVAVTEKGKLLGVIYRSSLLALSSTKSEALAKDLMEEPPFTFEPDSPLAQVVSAMLRHDEWYAFSAGPDRTYYGAVGLENVISYALAKAPEALEAGKVEEIMTTDVVSATPDDFVSSVWRLMRERKYAGLPVVDSKNRVVGIITQYDLIRKGYSRIELESESGARRGPRVREAMTTGVTVVYPWHTVRDAAELMVERGYGRLPVVDGPKTRQSIDKAGQHC